MVTTAPRISLPDEDRLEWSRLARIEKARRCAQKKDILGWGQALFPDKFPLAFCHPLHTYLIDIRGDPFTSTKAPRYHSKTTIKGFLVPIYQAVYEPTEFSHYLHVQATDKKANAVNRSIRYEFEENLELCQLVGDLIGDRWTDEQFVLKNGVCFTAVSAGQSIRGINYRNRRPDYLMPDDLYNEDDIYNPEATEKKNEWFWSTLYPARAQGRRTSVQLIGTATNELDLLNQVEKVPWIKARTFQALPGWDGHPLHPVTPLWPEKNSFEDLMRDMQVMTSAIFMREMQNEPRDDKTSIVKIAWIKEYDPAQLAPRGTFEYVGCVLGCDPSIGSKEENDYTAITLMYVFRYTDGQGYHYFLDQLWNEHLSLDARVKLLQDIQDRQPEHRKITTAYIEGIAGFKDFVAEVKRRTTLPVREVPEPGKKYVDKLAHLEAKAWFFETGRIAVNQNIEAKLKDNWKYQMTTNHPRYDDLRDATLLPLELIKRDAMAYAD